MLTDRFNIKLSLIASLLLGLTATRAAALELATPFADGAVLQREMKVPVWGWAEAGQKITVTFGKQTKTATTGKDGKWRVELDPLKASFDPAVMTIAAAGKSVTIKDILVGEVWMATGQSNMQWVASKTDVARTLLPQIAERVAAGEIKDPVVREGKVTDYFSALHPVEHATLEWSEDRSNFSAIASAFAYKLAEELDVPIGILNCSFSTTSIQAWVPRVGFRDGTDPRTKQIYLQTLQTDPTTPQFKEAWDKFYADIEATIAANKVRVANGEQPEPINTKPPGNLNGNRDASWMYNARVNPIVPYAIRGCIWNQGYASQNEGLDYYHLLHAMVRGWRIVWDRPDLPVYFHQFYRGGNSAEGSEPTIGSTSEMRLGTWLARDIPNADMASQIDIGGGIHYFNKARPGQRLALHALKNQYGKDIIANGPMFKSYTVKGDKLIVELDHADGLVVGNPDPKNMATVKVIPNGEDKVKLFYVADDKRVWYPATFKIDGNKVIVSSPKVSKPRGVSYAASGVGFQPNLYNKAMLPTTPFIYYDNELVTSKTWPEPTLKIDGVEPPVAGLEYEYRKMPVLSTQFRPGAVLQAGQPVTIWGSAVHPWVHYGADQKRTDGKAQIHFSFGDIRKTINVEPPMTEWQVTLPPMPAGPKTYTIKAAFTIDGEVIHERVADNVVFGDVWYVAAPAGELTAKMTDSGQIVRMLPREAKRSGNASPSRFSIAVSTSPPDENRFASNWTKAEGFAAALGHRIAAKTGNPVGIVFMQTNSGKGEPDKTDLASWMAPHCLKNAPSLMEDYKQLASLTPGNEFYDENARRYADAWRAYWTDYIPALMNTGKVPDARAWGTYPSFAAEITTKATHTYNVLTHSFTPASLKGIVFMPSQGVVGDNGGAYFAEQMSALANCFKKGFGGDDPVFIYGMPGESLAPKAAAPAGIHGKSVPVEFNQWPDAKDAQAVRDAMIEAVMNSAYE